MKKKYKYGTLVANVGNIFPTIAELEEMVDNEWYLNVKEYYDDIAELNYYKRTINKKVDENDFESLLLFVQKKIKLKLLTNIYKYSRLYETTVLEYNPLWNVDGTEERTITREKDGSSTDTYNETITDAKTGSDTDTKTGTDTQTTGKTTYDSNTFYDTERNTDTPNTTDTLTYNNTNTNTHTGTKGTVDGEEEETHETLVRQGNIGVTKSTELIDSQRRTVNFSYIEYVVHDLINDFTYLVD